VQEEMVIYNGKVFPKKGFRAFVYAKNGEKKLANSWTEYEEAIHSGLWFSKKENINAVISDTYIEEKKAAAPKRKRG